MKVAECEQNWTRAFTESEFKNEIRDRYFWLLEQSPAILNLHLGPDYIFDFVHKDTFLITNKDVRGKTLAEVFGGRDKVIPKIEFFDHVYLTGQPVEVNEVEYPSYAPNGEAIMMIYNFRLQPLKDPQGKIIGVATLVLDVTELSKAKQEADRANRAKTEFLNHMSHELRTPLNAIMGFNELQLDSADENERREFNERVHANAKHLLSVINESLNLARIEAGHIDIHKENHSLKTLIQESIQSVESLALKKNIRFDLKYPQAYESFSLYTDPQRVRQIVLNLLSNAIKFSPSGSAITISMAMQNNFIEIRVSDQGQGITLEEQALLFEKFGKRSTPISAPGTGLGLYLSRKLAKALDGDLTLEKTELGRGSVFLFRLGHSGISDDCPAEPLEMHV